MKRKLTTNQAKYLINEALSIISRQAYLSGRRDDPRYDLDKECGYNPQPDITDFCEKYRRSGLARRVVNIFPYECFAVDPIIYETERPRDTLFEKGYKALIERPGCNPNHYYQRIDALSGKGTFGALLYGFDDSKPLDTIVDGLDESGASVGSPKGRKLLYLRAFDESAAAVSQIQSDPSNPRFGYPQFYELTFQDVTNTNLTRVRQSKVHWSRVLHVAETEEMSEIYATPRLEPVFDRITDDRKLLGSDAEGYRKQAFPGIAIKTDPRWIEAGGSEVDQDSIDEEMLKFMDGLQHYISLVGLEADTLTTQVSDPTPHLMVQWTSISIALGIPLRILMGSEQAKLASGQDMKSWNRRLSRRQTKYLTPKLIRPFVDRLIAVGVIPPPKLRNADGTYKYEVFWPDINMPDEDERSVIADRNAACFQKYVQSEAYKFVQFSDWLRFFMGRTEAEILQIMENIKKPPEIEFEAQAVRIAKMAPKVPPGGTPKVKKSGDSGVAGKPPSDVRASAGK